MSIAEDKPTRFIVAGPTRLSGNLEVEGAKNAALKMLAAALLSSQPVRLKNVPPIVDVLHLIKIIEKLGAMVRWIDETTAEVNAAGLQPIEPDPQLVGHLRASVILIGPLLARFGRVKIHLPGGCKIGARSIETHLDAFRQLGIQVTEEGKYVTLVEQKSLSESIVRLRELSVTATENILIYCAGKAVAVHLKLAAREPEIANLVELLNTMGAEIKTTTDDAFLIHGVTSFKPAEVAVIPDRIVAGTYIIGALATGGSITITNAIPAHLDSLISTIERMGAQVKIADPLSTKPGSITVTAPKGLTAVSIDTRPYPGFPTDLQSPFAVLATQARGKTRIFETLFEGRFAYVEALQKMGAQIKIETNHIITISGPTQLTGTEVECSDLRGGAALVLAALTAQGKTTIQAAQLIDRGYDRMVDKLKLLGADLERQA